MDDTDVFLRQVRRLFAENVHQDEKIRLIGFRLGQLEELESRQTTLDFVAESEYFVHPSEGVPVPSDGFLINNAFNLRIQR